MLGFGDGWVAGAYILCIASALLCVVYGLIHYHDDDDETPASRPLTPEELEIEEGI